MKRKSKRKREVVEGPCRLCGEVRVLKRSHIIPELLWSPVYDPDTKKAVSARFDLPYDRSIGRGIREHLLCGECETRLGQHEDYFAKLWYGEAPFPATLRDGVRRNVNYTSFKLFHLAILWRAHVSSLPEFARVKLGPDAEPIRKALLSGVAPPEDIYPIASQAVVNTNDDSVLHGFLALPVPFQLDRGEVYAPIYAGCLWYVGVTPGVLAENETRLRSNGNLIIPTVSLGRFPRIPEIMFRNRDKKRGE